MKTRMIAFCNGTEVIVCPKKHEKETIKTFFDEGGRDKGDYDRIEIRDKYFSIDSRIAVDGGNTTNTGDEWGSDS
jgi:hypothetical protein